jgi:hypothetical protein
MKPNNNQSEALDKPGIKTILTTRGEKATKKTIIKRIYHKNQQPQSIKPHLTK